jgi:hypothetical protein
MKIKKFKIRASAASQLLTASGRNAKPSGKYGISVGTETYLNEWLIAAISERGKEIKSKYFDKGNIREPEALARMAKWFGLSELPKNETFYQDDYFTGTPDTPVFIHNGIKTIADAKCAFTEFTMPYFSPADPKYLAQLQVYMHLTGAEQGYVCHCLEQPLDKDIDRECYNRGITDITETAWNEVLADLGFDHLPDAMRIVSFGAVYDAEIIGQLQVAVNNCRQALHELIIPAFNERMGMKIEMKN